eukprot:2791128-Rhodomonas_salina.1
MLAEPREPDSHYAAVKPDSHYAAVKPDSHGIQRLLAAEFLCHANNDVSCSEAGVRDPRDLDVGCSFSSCLGSDHVALVSLLVIVVFHRGFLELLVHHERDEVPRHLTAHAAIQTARQRDRETLTHGQCAK